MAKKKKIKINASKEEETDFEIPNDIEAENPPPDASGESTSHDEPITESKSEAQERLERMLNDDFTAPISETSQPITEPEKGKRGRKKLVEQQPVLIPGELVVHICNNVSAGGLSLIDKWISKTPLPVGALSLTEEQALKLAPLAEKMIESWQIQSDPTSAFFATFGAMSLSNYILMKALQAKESKEPNR